MSAMGSGDLLRKLDRNPFKPFRVRMADERTFEVSHPHMVLVGATSAVVATRPIRDATGCPVPTDWREIAIGEIVELPDD
jgi:hypothetical protein